MLTHSRPLTDKRLLESRLWLIPFKHLSNSARSFRGRKLFAQDSNGILPASLASEGISPNDSLAANAV
jgi:hypothetical protein